MIRIAASLCALVLALSMAGAASADPPRWTTSIVDQDADWYATAEARAVADAVIQYQSPQGGWPKNTNLAAQPATPADIPAPDSGRANTFDNNGTTLPLEFLARVISAGGGDAYRPAFERGLDYTLAAQYPNGGWPQFYPLREGYYSRITFNDDAMVRVLALLREVAAGRAPYAFVDPARRARAANAVARGIDVILRTQIRQHGALTAWCAQYDETTLAPAWARAYEPPSLSGNESVGILRFLMSLETPTPEIIAAIEGGVSWLNAAALPGIRVEDFTNAEGQPDKRVVADTAAPPLWARFYELETNRPIFLDRDSEFRYSFAEIDHERRNGYAYYGAWPRRLLERDYPAWRARHGL